MKRNHEAVCGNCPYWERSEHPRYSKSNGRCSKYAPRPYLEMREAEDADIFYFPLTDDNTWCGEHPDFELKDEEAAKCPWCSLPLNVEPQHARKGKFRPTNDTVLCSACGNIMGRDSSYAMYLEGAWYCSNECFRDSK